jgi:hypothetical protein
MTAEIVLMNKNAVAMAADSAATLGNHIETWNTQNKLFSLSDYHPVGIMIYDQLQLNGVPWETIIKIYRKQLKNNFFNTLKEYMDDFLVFLRENETLFPEKDQVFFCEVAIKNFINSLSNTIYMQLQNNGGTINDFPEHLKKYLDEIEKQLNGTSNHDGYESLLEEKEVITFVTNDQIRSMFQPFTVSDELCRLIHQVIYLMVIKEDFRLGKTGIVISGFGENEHFPVTCSVLIGGFYNKNLKYSRIEESKVSTEYPSMILPFAQDDMAVMLVKGVHPHYEGFIENQIIQYAFDMPFSLVEAIDDLTPDQKLKWQKEFKDVPTNILRKIFSDVQEHVRLNYVNPIHAGISHLLKDELAATAESFVNIATFKKTVSPGDNSVGGAVDVAVISKGDGLIWINRKHYFDAEKNPQFFTKYYSIKE